MNQIRDRSGDLMEILQRWIEQADSAVETFSQCTWEGASEKKERSRYRAQFLRTLEGIFQSVLAKPEMDPLTRERGDL